MRIAVCLYGYFNNRVDDKVGLKGYNYLMNILKPYTNIDFFIHSWDLKNKTTIEKLYKPKTSEYCEQINFNSLFPKFNINEDQINDGFNRKGDTHEQCTLQASFSFFHTRSRSIQLKKKYEEDNNFKYDVVLVCRFDIGHRSGYHMGYNVSLLPFNPNLDMQYIYSAMWAQLNAGYADQWFYSNSDNIDVLEKMADSAYIDFQIGSDYNKSLIDGWFDSRDFSTNKQNQTSNEILREKEIDVIPHKYPRWQMINNHIYHKWFFKKSGLYEKSKFI